MEKEKLFLILLLISFSFGYWIKERIGPFGSTVYQVVIAKGRNDDTNRLYVTTENRLYEVTYRNNNWHILNIGSGYWGVCAGDGRNDGRIRIYTAFTGGSPQKAGVLEYTWTGSSWQIDTAIKIPPLSPSSPAAHGVVLGKARNDGINRIYCDDGNNSKLFEGYWDGTRWISNQILNQYGVDIIITSARRDGINRIYFVGQGTAIRELTWDGNQWICELVDSISSLYWGIACGYGRNDTILRLYSGSLYALYEFTWNGNRWIKERVKGFPRVVRCIVLGDGRNDGVIRIYVGSTGGALYAMEYSYWEGQWDSCWIDSSGILATAYYGPSLGDARNDGINRVYFGCSDGYVYEFSYVSVNINEERRNLLNISNNKILNPLGQVVANQKLKKGIYFIYEKRNLKKFIKIK
ncbi:MAG: hypothetical protein N2323_04220 [candidate division WOR-3 bacterium]|nr:hypothetical protein [candidate division WOR-3 bacterium]MCX7837148.1 hypothetical protein [candidate division WOR-3 bacterium]MDW8114345.1 hypothetical protein [candidate division WOR-3 bacterium]